MTGPSPAPARVGAGVPTGGQFAASARTEPGVALAPAPPVPAPTIPAFLRDQFVYGDCVHLAHALALRNPDWGVLVVGEATQDGDGFWDTGRIQHAWAVRSDGALVDIEGVHGRSVALDLAAARGLDVHQHTTAEEADEVWYPTAMEQAGEEDPGAVADYVMERWGEAPVGTLVLVDERDTDPDTDPDTETDEDVQDALDFAADYCDAAGGARPGMCFTASWNVREEFGWPIVGGARDGVTHHWNRMPDGRFFDATAEMFGDDGPQVVAADDPRYQHRFDVAAGDPT